VHGSLHAEIITSFDLAIKSNQILCYLPAIYKENRQGNGLLNIKMDSASGIWQPLRGMQEAEFGEQPNSQGTFRGSNSYSGGGQCDAVVR
jgi:hypothetical protein